MNNVQTIIKSLLNDKLKKLEEHLNGDIFCFYGSINDGFEIFIKGLIEDLAAEIPITKRERLIVILTTGGGSAIAVDRWVDIIRQHYKIVDFIVPDYAYSAGTIFCMSGDNIYMDYASALGPIDPQVQNKEGKFIPALGYLDKVNEAIEKSRNKTITEVEYLMIKDLDLAELRLYEQAKELTIELLKKWLVKYKFKKWTTHQTTPSLLGKPVTDKEKEERASEIAGALSDNTKWKYHGRAINIDALKKLRLEIIDYSNMGELKDLIADYYDLLYDNILANKLDMFIHTRKFI